ncbi:hypothetical protein TEA_028979 [Camellia sinensis var. sinensis]|uniref:Small nuclear ribonucleoprotein E n=1 Tax=Camellia sinensis var. sinensis TaxID=542762 RepID=A0A4S4E6F1_CAMSN|nr:hypothetical protein TEA_028979 [Camellia sinensis var. sinensis]
MRRRWSGDPIRARDFSRWPDKPEEWRAVTEKYSSRLMELEITVAHWWQRRGASAAALVVVIGSDRSELAMATTKVQRIMNQPINLIFRFLQSKARIQIWLFEQKDSRIEGRIIGFDEYMNLVLDDAEEGNVKKKTRKA